MVYGRALVCLVHIPSKTSYVLVRLGASGALRSVALNQILLPLSAFNQIEKTTTGALKALIVEKQQPVGSADGPVYVGQLRSIVSSCQENTFSPYKIILRNFKIE